MFSQEIMPNTRHDMKNMTMNVKRIFSIASNHFYDLCKKVKDESQINV